MKTRWSYITDEDDDDVGQRERMDPEKGNQNKEQNDGEEGGNNKDQKEEVQEQAVEDLTVGKYVSNFKKAEEPKAEDKEVEEAVDTLLGLVVDQNLWTEEDLSVDAKLQG